MNYCQRSYVGIPPLAVSPQLFFASSWANHTLCRTLNCPLILNIAKHTGGLPRYSTPNSKLNPTASSCDQMRLLLQFVSLAVHELKIQFCFAMLSKFLYNCTHAGIETCCTYFKKVHVALQQTVSNLLTTTSALFSTQNLCVHVYKNSYTLSILKNSVSQHNV